MSFLVGIINGVSIGNVISGISILIAFVFYFKQKQKKILEHKVTSAKMITKDIAEIPDLHISIDGDPVSYLIATTVEFINVGNTTIRSEDIASKAPIQIVSSGHFFNAGKINAGYIKTEHQTLNPSVNVIEGNKINISFEYLDPKQTFSITIWHDGEISVLGKIKGGKHLPYKPKVEVLNGENSTNIALLNFLPHFVLLPLIFIIALLLMQNIQLKNRFNFDFDEPTLQSMMAFYDNTIKSTSNLLKKESRDIKNLEEISEEELDFINDLFRINGYLKIQKYVLMQLTPGMTDEELKSILTNTND